MIATERPSSTTPIGPTSASIGRANRPIDSFQSLAADAATSAAAAGAIVARISEASSELQLVGVVGIPSPGSIGWRHLPLDGDSPLARAAQSRRTVVQRGALLPETLGTGSAVALPLTVSGRRLGVLGLEYAASQDPAALDLARLERVAAAVAETFDEIERTSLRRLSKRLQTMTGLLAGRRSRSEIGETIVLEGIDAVGAVAGSLALLDAEREELKVVAAHGYPPDLVAAFDPMRIDFAAPLVDATVSGELVVLESPEELDARYPAVRARRRRPADGAALALPLAAGGTPFGALAFSFATPRVISDEERAFLLALSRLCAQALDRALRGGLYDRMARLQFVTAELATAMTPADVAHVILHEGLAVLEARGGRVALTDPVTGVLTTIAMAGIDAEIETRLVNRGEIERMPVPTAAARDKLVLIGSLDASREEWPIAAREFTRLGDRAVAAVPLRSRHGVAGAMGFTWTEEREFTDDDVSFLGALAGVCGQALERARFYEESERSRMHLRSLLDRLGEAVIAVDAQLRVTYANQEAMTLFGDRHLSGLLLPNRFPELRLREAARLQLEPEAESVHERLTLRDGRVLEVMAMADDAGATLVLRDVSRQERQERIEREFVENAAHELLTPLAAIAAAAEALELGAKDNAAERDYYIAGVADEVRRLVKLSDALLLLARAQADPTTLRNERVDLEPLLTEIATRLDVAPAVRVVVECQGCAVLGERALVDGALTNIARNASRHTRKGTITLSGRRVGDRVVIEVSDTGTGMNREVRARAAARFFRAGDRGRDGFGLGLAIAHEMVRALGGELAIASRPGAGTTLSITLDSA